LKCGTVQITHFAVEATALTVSALSPKHALVNRKQSLLW